MRKNMDGAVRENNRQTRKDRIYTKLVELTKSIDFNCIDEKSIIGFDATYIGQLLNIRRNNVSKELNELLSELKVIKIKGKPVLFLDKSSFESSIDIQVNLTIFDSYKSFINIISKTYERDVQKNKTNTKTEEDRKNAYSMQINKNKNNMDKVSILDSFIGAKGSLKIQIQQAKAAIIYPPRGLHTLILGETGVGKSTFAEAMHKFAIDTGIMLRDTPFIIFNCADYSDNPHLLVSHIFGHVKGAFTGADKEKKGIIDYANGGILFLDEVHRLPPEGQEMLFLLIDKGTYRRLGESESKRQASLLIIAATTEDPHINMLPTFIRRIPMLIKLPSLEDRTYKERIELIYEFFNNEAFRVKEPIRVSKEVIKALMAYKCNGNIGQLKSDIQLICARAFLDFTTYNSKIIEVKLAHIPQQVREGFFIRKRSEELNNDFYLEDIHDAVFSGLNNELQNNFFISNYKSDEDFYEMILRNWNKFSELGYSKNKIRKKIDSEIEIYFNKILSIEKSSNNVVNKQLLLKIVSKEVLEAVEEALELIKETYNITLSQKVLLGLSLHVQTLLKRLSMGQVISHPDEQTIITSYQEDYKAARKIKSTLESRLLIDIPQDEIAFLTMFLHALKMNRNEKNIGVLVIAHGQSVASSMAQVANSLLGVSHVNAINMPLEEKVEVILEKSIKKVKQIDEGKGVLLLTDMGSLNTFAQIITEKTGIPTRTLDMVSTPIVIEATRKALIPNSELDVLVEDIKMNIKSFELQKTEYNSLISTDTYEVRYLDTALEEILDSALTFLNPRKACRILMKILDDILLKIDEKIDQDIKIKFLFHCSCVIERSIKGDPIPYDELETLKDSKKDVFEIISNSFNLISEVFDTHISDTEIAYVVEIFDTHFNTLN